MGKFKKTARVIGIVVLAVVIVCEVVLLARFLYLQNKQNAEKKQLNAYLAQIKELETMKDKEGVSSLSGVNGDFVAWIKCADIGLSLPIVQARADAAEKEPFRPPAGDAAVSEREYRPIPCGLFIDRNGLGPGATCAPPYPSGQSALPVR